MRGFRLLLLLLLFTTINAASPSSTLGKRKRAKPHGALKPWTMRRSRRAAVHAMKTADLNHFLVLCALVSELYCRAYNPRQSLEKNSNLARTAAHIDTVKIVPQPSDRNRQDGRVTQHSKHKGPRFQARILPFG